MNRDRRGRKMAHRAAAARHPEPEAWLPMVQASATRAARWGAEARAEGERRRATLPRESYWSGVRRRLFRRFFRP